MYDVPTMQQTTGHELIANAALRAPQGGTPALVTTTTKKQS